MTTLYKKNGVSVSDEFIEIGGEQFPRDLLWSVRVYKYNEELKGLAWGTGAAIAGLVMVFSLKWTIIGIILVLLGGFLAYSNGKSISEGKIETGVMLSFALNQDIRNLTYKHIKFSNKKDADELKMVLQHNTE